MTDKQRYELLLGELAEILQHKNNTIALQKYEINSLKRKLEEAENVRQ